MASYDPLQSLSSLLSLPHPPRSSVLSACRSLGLIPNEYRGRVYCVLLGVSEESVLRTLEALPLPTTVKVGANNHDHLSEVTSRLSVDEHDTDDSDDNRDNHDNNRKDQGHQNIEGEGASSEGPHPSSSTRQSQLSMEPDPLPNQRVIHADALRTKGSKPQIERLLTHYCRLKQTKYKQGLNEVLSPFLTITDYPGPPELLAFGCFNSFLSNYLPTNVYTDDSLTSLQACHRFHRLLLLYHSPSLCALLDGHRMPPELYATPWYLTAFAQRLPVSDLFAFWDQYLLHESPHLHHFACLSLLLRSGSTLSDATDAFLPEVLQAASSAIESVTPASLLEDARALAAATPDSLIALLTRACWGGNDSGLNERVRRLERQSLRLVLQSVRTWSCIPISADEAVGFALRDWGREPRPKHDTPKRGRARTSSSEAGRREKRLMDGDEEISFDDVSIASPGSEAGSRVDSLYESDFDSR